MKYRVRKGFVYVVSQRERYSAGQIVEVDEPLKVKPHMLEVVEVKVKPAAKVEKPAVVAETEAPKAKKTPAKRTAKKTTSRRRKTTKKVKAGE